MAVELVDGLLRVPTVLERDEAEARAVIGPGSRDCALAQRTEALEDPAELPLAEGRWHVGHAHEAILAVLRHRVPPRDALLPAGTSAKTPVHVVVGAEVLIVRSRSADAAGAADVTTARPDAGAVLLVARRPCRFLPRGFLLVRRRRPPGFPSSKTS